MSSLRINVHMLELRYAFRALFNNRALAIAAIVCLAVGIGANTAIYTVVNAVVLRPLPFKDPDRLVRVYTEFPTYGSSGGFHKFWMSTPELLDLRRHDHILGIAGGLRHHRHESFRRDG